MRAGHVAEFFRPLDAGKEHEVLDRVFVGAPGARVADILEPFDLGRHIGQALELGGGQQTVLTVTLAGVLAEFIGASYS